MKPAIALALLSLFLDVPNLAAQLPLAAGQRVRVTSREQGLTRQAGAVIAATDGALTVRIERRLVIDTLILARSSIDRLEVSTDSGRATGRGAAIGFGIGALLGGTIGYALVSSCHDCYLPPTDGAGYGIVALGTLGAIIGAIAGHHHHWDRWEEVPALRAGAMRLPDGRLGVHIAFRF